jgi:glycogen(starch) synthase
VNRQPLTVLMTADAVGGVWSYALRLCAGLPGIRFILATLGPRPRPAQRAAAMRLANVRLIESDFRLEWMQGGDRDVDASRQWLDGLARRHAVGLIHVNGYAQAALNLPCPVVVVAHSDVLSWLRAVRREPAPAQWRSYRRQVVAGLRAATRVVAPTRAVQHDLTRQYGLPLPKARVIANGIDAAVSAPLPKLPVIMAAGRVWDEAKNLAVLDDIAAQLDWPVEIAGALAHPESRRARLRHARSLGMLDAAAMQRRLGEAAIFAAPARYEPFGLAILEAGAAGCALVLGDIGSLRENWDGAAVFLPSDDRDQWRSTLARLIDDDGQREWLAMAARTRARRYTLARMARSYRGLYRELTSLAAQRRAA